MEIHCVVTGQNESGKSVIARNTPIKPVSLALLPGYEFHRIWGSDSIPKLPSDGTPPSNHVIFHERVVSASGSSLFRRTRRRASIRSAPSLLSKKFSKSCRG